MERILRSSRVRTDGAGSTKGASDALDERGGELSPRPEHHAELHGLHNSRRACRGCPSLSHQRERNAMPKLVKIGERIINLDTIAFVERTIEGGEEVVTLFYQPLKQWWWERD